MNKKLLFSIIFTLIYALITLIVVLRHEIWADEAQVWMLSKYLSYAISVSKSLTVKLLKNKFYIIKLERT